MIEIELPDGSIAEFPDGMSDDQITIVLQKQFAPKPDITAGDADPYLHGLVRQGLQGATLNWGDELRAGASAGIGALTGQGDFGDLYRVTRDHERAQQEAFQRNHPKAALAAELAGGLVTGTLGGIKAAGTTLGKNIAAKTAAQGLKGRMGIAAALGATTGAGGGAVAGAGSAQEKSDIPREAAKGALIGGGSGLFIAPGLEAGGSLLRAGKKAFRDIRNPDFQAAKNVEKAMRRDNLTTPSAIASIKPSGLLADTPAAREALETAVNQPGSAKGLAEDVLTARSRAANTELMSDLGPGVKFETRAALKDFRMKEASPRYEAAFRKGVERTEELESIFKTLEKHNPGIYKDAKNLGELIEANAGRTLRPDEFGTTRPSLRGWQYIKETLDDKISRLRLRGANKKANALNDTRKRLLKELDAQNPDYAKAREMWAGAARFDEMIDESKRFMTMPASEFKHSIAKLSKADKEAVRVGAIQAIEDRIERAGWTHDVAKLFRTPAMEKKMKALFDTDAEFNRFMNKIETLTEQQQTMNQVLGNSSTSRREAARADSNNWVDVMLDTAIDAATGSPSGLLGGIIRKAGRKAAGVSPSSTEAAREATARLLLESNPEQMMMNYQRGQGLLNAPIPQAQNPLFPAQIGGLLGTGAALGVLP